ncbi:thiamine pyrophosphate-binding protein [Streptomonospora sp. PA3]|uniref:thiamine pyrophosphate-binding protein n=1 Tax=Streptomonospora sp. PA3 TaxID=2607326 RepID=UPI0012DEA5B6|nr:thiamine pyrophosphate-binding protein [Streptomonospora sp. PA3]MUL41437.1 thiamine pyrophosphate-binding protein [Streptomonospora sp. PA3]
MDHPETRKRDLADGEAFVGDLRSALRGQPVDVPSLAGLFRGGDGRVDALRCAQLLSGGRVRAERILHGLCRERGAAEERSAEISRAVVGDLPVGGIRLSGAEAVAVMLAAAGVHSVFAYAGTSELALCDAVERTAAVRLVNGRGDKESAFFAAGASLLRPNRGAAVLHGARGLTNAAGALADARRNESGTMFVVGLPSSGSARFLPPHGEKGLLQGMAALANWTWESPAVPTASAQRAQAGRRFVERFRHGLAATAEPPHGPALFGLPQDVAEQRWIPLQALLEAPVPGPPRRAGADGAALDAAVRALRAAERPLVLIDDYALRYDGVQAALDGLSRTIGAPVLQLRYRRGPMLFERLQPTRVANFGGWMNRFSATHADLLAACDLLITVEDRNCYQRVAGRLPDCRKIAINTDPEKVRKNEYLGSDDPLVIGDPALALRGLAEALGAETGPPRAVWAPIEEIRAAAWETPEPASPEIARGRRGVAEVLAEVLGNWPRPVLVDDSQMFGGLLAEHYDRLPAELRVFGGHGGFVGGGLAYAVGAALAGHGIRVMCTLGDQAFTNSFQGLVAALQEQARVLFVVCNNGASVSLNKQADASFGAQPGRRSYLDNVDGFSYHGVAASMGIPAERVAVPIGGPAEDVDAALVRLAGAMKKAGEAAGPSLVELVLPSDPEVWRGIWLTQGFEQIAEAAV